MSRCRDHICQIQSGLYLDSLCCCRLRFGSTSGVLGLFLQELTDSLLLHCRLRHELSLRTIRLLPLPMKRRCSWPPALTCCRAWQGPM